MIDCGFKIGRGILKCLVREVYVVVVDVIVGVGFVVFV